MSLKTIPEWTLPLSRVVLSRLCVFVIPLMLVMSGCVEPKPVDQVESKSVDNEESISVDREESKLGAPEQPTSGSGKWEHAGWGGGGYYYAAAFHPIRDGVIYLAGDVGGVYKTEDHGRNWRMINNGLVNYAVFSLAVDRTHPDTVYAATEGGLCKSIDAGENWQFLTQTGPQELYIIGKKKKSIRSVAVDPSDGNTVYAASPKGKVFKSIDGGQSWKDVYTMNADGSEPGRLRLQYGKANGDYHAGVWTSIPFPENVNPADAVGFGLNFKGDRSVPKSFFVYLKGEGLNYRSRDLKELFEDDQARDIILRAEDFTIDPAIVKKNPDKAAAMPDSPEWSKINRVDMSCVGDLPRQQHVVTMGSFFIAATQTTDGQVGSAEEPVLVSSRVFSNDSKLQTYGNMRVGDSVSGSIYTVAVSENDPSRVIAATHDNGLVLSRDKGETWIELSTPTRASSAAFDPNDADTIYGTFFFDGIWKSSDAGKTWVTLSEGQPEDTALLDVAVSPASSQDVYAIGRTGWDGTVFRSNDAGKTWGRSTKTKADYAANPTLPQAGSQVRMSVPTNISINPLDPNQLYMSANWRCSFSEDGGVTWEERIKGADISCVTDIQFIEDRTYVTAMDEGTLVSENNGETWKQLWPLKHDNNLIGHNWRVRVTSIDGVDRIISTGSPWGGKYPQLVVVSDDGGKTYKPTTEGLPDYRITSNTMWGRGYPRALAVDPSDPNIVYLGIDGNATQGKSGGGVFKSNDGGHSWKQLTNQPGSRRMYYGLAIDPKAPQRIYWAGFGSQGGVYRSEDAGESWERVFSKDQYLFNLMTTADGTVYAGGKQLYRSTDQGKTWKTLTRLEEKRSIVGIEVHPNDPNTLWISANVWSNAAKGTIYKSTDGGATWVDITGDIPFNHPQVLRFNPTTSELWAGYVGIYKIKQ